MSTEAKIITVLGFIFFLLMIAIIFPSSASLIFEIIVAIIEGCV